jgi:hypothetical protein
MPRFTRKTTIKELEQFIKREIEESEEGTGLHSFLTILEEEPKHKKLMDDLSKFGFLWQLENLIDLEDKHSDSPYCSFPLLGYHYHSGVSFLGLMGGSDYGEPMFFVLYQDDKNKLRGYIPSKGNSINPFSKMIFGEDEELDDKFAKEKGYEDYHGLVKSDELLLNHEELLKDILKRIKIKAI